MIRRAVSSGRLRPTRGAAAFAAVLAASAPVAARPARPPAAPAPAAPAPAAAPATAAARAEAKVLSKRAQSHFDLGEYDAAIADFKEAYRLFPTPGLLYNLGQAHRLKGDCAGALTMYRNYLRLQPDAAHRAVVEKHIVDMEACDRQRRDADAARAAAEPDDAPAAPLPAGPPPARPSSSAGGLRLAGLITAGAGAALLGAGGYFALDASAAEQDVEDGIVAGATWSELADSHDRGQRSELLGAGLAAAGGVAVIAGAALYLLGARSTEAPAVTVAAGSGAGRLVVGWGF